jgi:hypothetical protein
VTAYSPRICPDCQMQSVVKDSGHRICLLCCRDFDEPVTEIEWVGNRQQRVRQPYVVMTDGRASA